MNGSQNAVDGDATPQMHLGKRKRSESPDKKLLLNGEDAASLQQNLKTTLQNFSGAKALQSILSRPLTNNHSEKPDPKRVRLSLGRNTNTIQRKIENSTYTTLVQVVNDVQSVLETVLKDEVVGSEEEDGSKSLRAMAEEFISLVSDHGSGGVRPTSAEAIKVRRAEGTGMTGQIITLRSQTEQGPRQLYSGLQKEKSGEQKHQADIDGRRLPNGFDLTYPNTIDPNSLAPAKEKRTFGEVFKPSAKTKVLELPRSTRNTFRSNTLEFVSEPSLDRSPNLNRNNYKFQTLAAGTWLNYSKGAAQNDQDLLRKQRERTLASPPDLRTVTMANDSTSSEAEDPASIFKKVFSSFAPTSDSSRAVVPEQDRDREWWHKFGRKRLRKVFKTEYPDLKTDSTAVEPEDVNEQDIEGIVSDFAGPEESIAAAPDDDPNTIDEVLSEVSQLLETVHSYQDIRNHDTRVRSDLNLPSSDEYDTYELLRSQLAILVSSLPPFAVAKLDGDKLSDLNISTQVLVETPDYRGTAQLDDYTQSRYRSTSAVNSVTAAATRPGQPTQARQNYQTPNTFGRYGSNLQSYSQNASVGSASYGQRTTTNYQTPGTAGRPYQNTSYHSASGSYSAQPNLQQFQRPTPNGYTTYGSSQSQGGYTQTPSQPGYQQRAQTQALNLPNTAGRAGSPPKPAVNGQLYGQAVNGR